MLAITLLLSFIQLSLFLSLGYALPFPRASTFISTSISTPNSNSASHGAVVKSELNPTLSTNYVAQGPVPSDTLLEIRMALVQSNASGLEAELYAVSDPDSTKYGEFLNKEQVEALVAPSQATTSTVSQWLTSNGLKSSPLSPAGDFISVNMTAGQANSLLDADYTLYVNTKTNVTVVMTPEYAIPAELDGHVEFVWGSLLPDSNLRSKSSKQYSSKSSSSSKDQNNNTHVDPACQSSSGEIQVTPKCLQKIYNIPDTKAESGKSSIGISTFGLSNNTFSGLQSDLESFLGQFRPDLSNKTSFLPVTLNIDGSLQVAQADVVEADLDLQYTNGLASGVPTTLFDVGSSGARHDDIFLDMMHLLLSQADGLGLPKVVSTSFSEEENNFDPRMAQRLCRAIAQLGARGTSVIFSSGDGGVSGDSFDSLYSCGESTTRRFIATFPSGCPYLTSVGSVDDVSAHAASYFSSGGFSDIFPTPSFQQNSVDTYLKELGNQVDASAFNRSGRGYPDVSLQGEYFIIQALGQQVPVNGTSASAPSFASMIALLNDKLLKAGKSPLGWLNPWLYKVAGKAFNDVTSGSNVGCNVNGFPALNGWDPVTGLGSPDFEKLSEALRI